MNPLPSETSIASDLQSWPAVVTRAGTIGQARLSLRDLSILFAIVLVTRLPFLGIAEPDSALFATGARQWLRGGSNNLSIYSAHVCATYYAVVVALIKGFHRPENDCSALMSVLSLVSCLGILAFGYLLGLRIVGPKASLAAMLLFAFSPGLWWTTVEPHPQAVSICFGLLAIWSFCRYLESDGWLFAAVSIVSFAFAIAIKNDAVLMLPALFAIVLWIGSTRRNILRFVVIAGCSAALSMLIAKLVLGGMSQVVSSGGQSILTFVRIPTAVGLLKQVAPILFGMGIVTVIALPAFGMILNRRRSRDPWRWWGFVLVWCLPGYLFWIFVAGNNVRHVAAFGIPLFWLIARSLPVRYVLASVLLGLFVPPNSNTFMFPSPNVPGSARLLAQKKMAMSAVADALVKQSSCFVGSYTNDYLANALLDRGGVIESQLSESDVSTAAERMPDGSTVLFNRIDTNQKHLDLGSCQSLEYGRDGNKVRFMGGEWHIPIV